MKLFISNADYGLSDEEIERIFEVYGPVDEVKRLTHADGRKRGVVFVTMWSDEEAMKAMVSENGKAHNGRTWHVEKAYSRQEFLEKKATKQREAEKAVESGKAEGQGRGEEESTARESGREV